MSNNPQTPEVDDPRVLALAKARQQMAHRNPFNVVCPPWDGLSEQEQHLSLLDARNYLRAAIDAGLIPAMPVPPATHATDRAATCICGHTEQQHFEDACITEITGCDCGDYLVPEAAREVIARWREAAGKAERIRENADFHLGQEMARRQLAEKETVRPLTELRRMADEAQQQKPTGRDAEIEQMRERHKASLRRADEINNELMEEVQRYAAGTERPVLWSVYNAMHLRAANAEALIETLVPLFEGFGRLLATSSRDWGQYAPDAWLWAVICGWDCEQTEHDDTCVHGAMEEMAQRHGWDAATVAKARRYRAAVRALTATAASGPGRVADEGQPESDEQRADREETERDHASGNHAYCGVTCEAEFPTAMLRNGIPAKGYPGTAGMLDELLRRARKEGRRG